LIGLIDDPILFIIHQSADSAISNHR